MYIFEIIDVVLFSTPLFCLYVKLVVSLWKKRKDFFSAFYRIVLFGGIIDCTSYTMFLTFRFANTDFYFDNLLHLLNTYTFYLSPLKFFVYLMVFMTHMTPFLMAVNRATSLCLPLYYDRMWRNHTMIISASYLVVPTLLSGQLLFKPAAFILVGNMTHGFVVLEYDHSYTFGPHMSTALIFYCLVVALLTLMCNLLCAIKLLKYRFQNTALAKNNMRMVVCAMIVFMNEVLVIFSQIIVAKSILDQTLTLRIIIPFIFDIHSLMPGFIVICTVPQLRQATIGDMIPQNDSLFMVTSVSNAKSISH